MVYRSYNKNVFHVIANTNFSNATTTNTLANLTTDDYDFFSATYNGFYGQRTITIASLIGTNSGGELEGFTVLIGPTHTNFPVQVGDTITILGDTLDPGVGTGELIFTLQLSNLESFTIESPDNRFHLTQSWSESFDYGAIDRSIINSTYFNQSSSQYISASYKGIRYGQIHSDQSEFYTGIFTGSFITS